MGLRSPLEPVVNALRAYEWVVHAEPVAPVVLRVEVRSLAEAETKLPPALADAGASVVWLGPEEVSLERAFLELTR